MLKYIRNQKKKLHELTDKELLDNKKRGLNFLLYWFIIMALSAWMMNTNSFTISGKPGTIIIAIMFTVYALGFAYVGLFSLETNRRKLLNSYRTIEQIQEQCQRHNIIFDSMKKENDMYLLYFNDTLVATYENGKMYTAN